MTARSDEQRIARIEKYLADEVDVHKDIRGAIDKLQAVIANGSTENKKQFRLADGFLLLLTAVMAIVGYFYVDDRQVMRKAHSEFSETLRKSVETESATAATLEALTERIERDHERFERNFDKLQPDRPRFDFQDHEETHDRWRDPSP
jgi:predicted outer membrane protein